MAVRVFHGDDSDMFRMLVAEVLPDEDIEVCGQAATADEVCEGVRREQPDVVLLDQIGGPELLDRVRDAAPHARIVILSGHLRGDGDREVEARADGYLVKTSDVEAMRAAVRGA